MLVFKITFPFFYIIFYSKKLHLKAFTYFIVVKLTKITVFIHGNIPKAVYSYVQNKGIGKCRYLYFVSKAYFSSFSIPFLILEIVSSFPTSAAISVAPPGVNCFPERAQRIGHST